MPEILLYKVEAKKITFITTKSIEFSPVDMIWFNTNELIVLTENELHPIYVYKFESCLLHKKDDHVLVEYGKSLKNTLNISESKYTVCIYFIFHNVKLEFWLSNKSVF